MICVFIQEAILHSRDRSRQPGRLTMLSTMDSISSNRPWQPLQDSQRRPVLSQQPQPRNLANKPLQ